MVNSNSIKHILDKLNLFDFQVYCHICGNVTDTDWICARCGEHYCDDCGAPFTIHTQIDYPCCVSCYDVGYYD